MQGSDLIIAVESFPESALNPFDLHLFHQRDEIVSWLLKSSVFLLIQATACGAYCHTIVQYLF